MPIDANTYTQHFEDGKRTFKNLASKPYVTDLILNAPVIPEDTAESRAWVRGFDYARFLHFDAKPATV